MQQIFDDNLGVPSASREGKIYYPRFENNRWVCDSDTGPCEHFKYRHTDCRHILKKKLEQDPGYKGGVRETSLEAYIELIMDPDSLNERYQEILVAFYERGKPSTDREITRHLMKGDPNYVRPRRFELSDKTGKYFYKPLVEQVSKRECEVTHKRVIAWGLTEYGRKLTESYR